MQTSSGTPLEETEWYQSGGHQEWRDRNRRWGYAARFLKAYEGKDERMLTLRRKATQNPKAENPEDKAAKPLAPMELEEVYAFSRNFPELPPAEPEPTGKKPKGFPKASYAYEAQRARELGLVPLSDEHRAELRRKLEKLNVGVRCEFIYLTESSHLTRKGEFVSFDEKEILLMSDKGTFWKVPIEKVFHGTYNIEQQGGKIK